MEIVLDIELALAIDIINCKFSNINILKCPLALKSFSRARN